MANQIERTPQGYLFPNTEGHTVELLEGCLAEGEEKAPEEWLTYEENGTRPINFRTLYQIMLVVEGQRRAGDRLSPRERNIADECNSFLQQNVIGKFLASGVQYHNDTSATLWHLNEHGARISSPKVEVPREKPWEHRENTADIKIADYDLSRQEPLPAEYEAFFRELCGPGYEQVGYILQHFGLDEKIWKPWRAEEAARAEKALGGIFPVGTEIFGRKLVSGPNYNKVGIEDHLGVFAYFPVTRDFEARIRFHQEWGDMDMDSWLVLDCRKPIKGTEVEKKWGWDKSTALGVRIMDDSTHK